MSRKTLKPKAIAWEKAGIVLLNKYLDTLAPPLREWIDSEELKEWPEDMELWDWDITHGYLGDGFDCLIQAFGSWDYSDDS